MIPGRSWWATRAGWQGGEDRRFATFASGRSKKPGGRPVPHGRGRSASIWRSCRTICRSGSCRRKPAMRRSGSSSARSSWRPRAGRCDLYRAAQQGGAARGGHPFPGHTEMLAKLSGTPEVSMMLATPKMRVIHVTTHIGLLDAIEKIEPALVERTIRRGHDALVRAGIARSADRGLRDQPARRRRRAVRPRRGREEGDARNRGCPSRGIAVEDRYLRTPSSSGRGAATSTWWSRCTTIKVTGR